MTALLQPVAFTMPDLRWPTTCGSMTCLHPMCLRWREQAKRRCSECDQLIRPGERLIAYRDPVTRDLISHQHERCPR